MPVPDGYGRLAGIKDDAAIGTHKGFLVHSKENSAFSYEVARPPQWGVTYPDDNGHSRLVNYREGGKHEKAAALHARVSGRGGQTGLRAGAIPRDSSKKAIDPQGYAGELGGSLQGFYPRISARCAFSGGLGGRECPVAQGAG